MKYAALVLNALALSLLVWVTHGAFKLTGLRAPAARPAMLELPPLSAAAQAEQAKVAEALTAMRRMTSADDGVKAASSLGLLALPAPGTPQVAGSVQLPRRSLTLHLENPIAERHIVVIDDHLVQRGDRLLNGGRVVRVRTHEAVVSEKDGQQTLTLPVADLRAGTLRWPDGTPASTATQYFKPGLPGAAPAAARSAP